MKKVSRTEVRAGQSFSITGDPVRGFPCVATDALVDSKIKSSRCGGQGYLWHLYTPTGSLSWSHPWSEVYVAE